MYQMVEIGGINFLHRNALENRSKEFNHRQMVTYSEDGGEVCPVSWPPPSNRRGTMRQDSSWKGSSLSSAASAFLLQRMLLYTPYKNHLPLHTRHKENPVQLLCGFALVRPPEHCSREDV
ncbi:hypothetical protein OUZ56_013515 [Daphnia magna]|uniref:Uncharacterized protein n=1 Tax=Daphnia magna TaxID=35525 RepID=A0ABQ9Z650_9CRUS|nr:hypothetical protein OUZ56_013515 [Daphnia magna]